MKLALPTGRLQAPVLELLEKAFINYRHEPRKHTLVVSGYDTIQGATLVHPRAIPEMVGSGAFHMGICGSDALWESGAKVEIVGDLVYGKHSALRYRSERTDCVLYCAEENKTLPRDFPRGTEVLSEYPKSTRRYFAQHGIKAKVIPCKGSSEAHVPSLYPYGVCLTETGESLAKNGLRILEMLFSSSIVLIANLRTLRQREKHDEIRGLRHQLRGVVDAREQVLIKMNVPRKLLIQVTSNLPALREPTVSPLAGTSDFVAVESVLLKIVVNALIPRLLKLGAEGIIVLPVLSLIEKW